MFTFTKWKCSRTSHLPQVKGAEKRTKDSHVPSCHGMAVLLNTQTIKPERSTGNDNQAQRVLTRLFSAALIRLSISRLRMGTDGKGVSTLVAF